MKNLSKEQKRNEHLRKRSAVFERGVILPVCARVEKENARAGGADLGACLKNPAKWEKDAAGLDISAGSRPPLSLGG